MLFVTIGELNVYCFSKIVDIVNGNVHGLQIAGEGLAEEGLFQRGLLLEIEGGES